MRKNKKHKIIISGYYGYDNLGDEAILYSMIKNFKKNHPDLEIVVLSGNPEKTEKKYQVKAVDRFNLFKISKEILTSSAFISGGGGLFQDVTGLKTLKYYLGLVFLARLMLKPVMIYAQGIGPINTKTGKFLTNIILNNVNLITVRDQNSKDILNKLNVKAPPILVTGDAAFSMDAPREEKKANKTIKVGISARPWSTGGNYTLILARFADLLIENYNASIYLLPFQRRQDFKICKDILSQMKGSARIVDGLEDPEEMLEFINGLDFLIAMRLHALIFAAICHVPFMGISYDPKVDSFMDLMKQNSLKVNELEINILENNFKILLTSRNNIKKILKENVTLLKEKANINNLLLLKLIKKVKLSL